MKGLEAPDEMYSNPRTREIVVVVVGSVIAGGIAKELFYLFGLWEKI